MSYSSIVPETAVVQVHTKVNDIHNLRSFTVDILCYYRTVTQVYV